MEYTRLGLDYIREPVVDSVSLRIDRTEGVHDPFADFHDEKFFQADLAWFAICVRFRYMALVTLIVVDAGLPLFNAIPDIDLDTPTAAK
jgi:hypothetical protein